MSISPTPSPRLSGPTPGKPPVIFLAATHTAKSTARTGIQTVVRSLICGLVAIGAKLYLVRRPKWGRHFSLLSAQQSKALGCSSEIGRFSEDQLRGSWLLVPEVVYDSRDHRMMRDAQRRGMRVAAIFHDAIPIIHPTLVRKEAAKCHAAYMETLTQADLVIAVSNTVADQFRDFARSRHLNMPPIQVCPLPGEMPGIPRQFPEARPPDGPVRILSVSTLDPRKNHAGLIRAFNLASSSLPGRELFLDLAGAPYTGAQNIVQEVRRATKANPRIAWHGSVTAEKLSQLYGQCDFTVYPSLVEGFGLPILESLWHGRPCLCANYGAMAETAAGGGCLTIDLRDSEKLVEAIVDLATQPGLRDRLEKEIDQRRFKTWSDYAKELCNELTRSAHPGERTGAALS